MTNCTEDSTQSTKKIAFASSAQIFCPVDETVLDEDDLRRMFYTNAEVRDILYECKDTGDLPTFWHSLRIQRVYLLNDRVAAAQEYQLSKSPKLDWDILARVSRKITSHSQRRANQQGLKDAVEAGMGEQISKIKQQQEEEANTPKASLISRRSLSSARRKVVVARLA